MFFMGWNVLCVICIVFKDNVVFSFFLFFGVVYIKDIDLIWNKCEVWERWDCMIWIYDDGVVKFEVYVMGLMFVGLWGWVW